MTNAIVFHSFDMSNNDDALTIEGVFQKYASFASVHGFEFEDKINHFDNTLWVPAGPNITVGSNTITTTHSVGTTPVWYSRDIPHSYVLEFTFHAGTWSAYIRADGADNWYRINYNETGYITLAKSVNGTVSILCEKELSGSEIVDWGRVRLAVRDAQLTADSPLRILYVSLWINDQLITSVSDNNSSPSLLKLGLVVNQNLTSGELIFSDIRMANLGETILTSSLDPGEKPIGGIQRAIEDRYIRYWVRWNGKLKAWAPVARTSSLTINEHKEFSQSLQIDQRQIISHVRVLGAFQWVQVFDDEMIKAYSQRFRELQNTALWNVDDCYNVGLEMLLRSKEQVYQVRFNTLGMIFDEIEDRVRIPDIRTPGSYVDYILDTITWTYKVSTLSADVLARQYFYGEPE